MIRPEAAETLRRWREVLIGGAVGGVGLWLALGWIGLLSWLGWAMAAAGIGIILSGIQRARFLQGKGGPGIVDVDEGQVTYYGPLEGGSAALEYLTRLDLDPSGYPAHWVLYQPGQPALHIPVNADGADALFDAFSQLPGLRTERMLAELRAGPGRPVTVWSNTNLRLH
ncbi:hypothetical protein SAMN05421688_2248 [Poseidonocella pacifica]|uniref:Uncharacterized protein n=1 Tax=Poseidonocella pacifica TaxID=871651 RepID=A0A1I0XGJ1_9RHOB|nr:hypothetical protein [Poseidonocella pacifica]SFB00091.1 hypothetical protein SAMN05421688_2248 [Poseidonocella pacifica]